MKAILLIAGPGSRLMPLTADRPQCLLDLNGKTILSRMVEQLCRARVNQVVLVTGHGKEKVMEEVHAIKQSLPVSITLVENPLYKTTSNIYSLWLAKQHMEEDILLIDGDIVFDDAILERAIHSSFPNLIMTDPYRSATDEDVKLTLDSTGITSIGKYVNPYKAHGISVGVHKFSKDAAMKLFKELDFLINSGQHNVFYEEAIEQLIRKHRIDALAIEAHHKWEDVDFMDEYETAKHVFR